MKETFKIGMEIGGGVALTGIGLGLTFKGAKDFGAYKERESLLSGAAEESAEGISADDLADEETDAPEEE